MPCCRCLLALPLAAPRAVPQRPAFPHTSPTSLRLPAPLQLSVLRLFESILSDPSIQRAPQHADLLSLAKTTTRNMFARCVG